MSTLKVYKKRLFFFIRSSKWIFLLFRFEFPSFKEHTRVPYENVFVLSWYEV